MNSTCCLRLYTTHQSYVLREPSVCSGVLAGKKNTTNELLAFVHHSPARSAPGAPRVFWCFGRKDKYHRRVACVCTPRTSPKCSMSPAPRIPPPRRVFLCFDRKEGYHRHVHVALPRFWCSTHTHTNTCIHTYLHTYIHTYIHT